MGLSKVKNILQHYSTPTEYDYYELEKCIDYDIQNVDHWLDSLRNYTHNEISLENRNILELGPGSDLGIGIYLISLGCSHYNAINVNDLMKYTPDNFYEQFFDRLKNVKEIDSDFLKEQLIAAKQGDPSRLTYVVRKDFNIAAAIEKSTIDLVFSYAAFEHFDDLDKTISQLNIVCKPGAIVIAEIDLKTHSRWIRKKDPNNIYRYSKKIYNLFWFRGIPKRIRPYQYKEAFERFGWTNVLIKPLMTIASDLNIYSGLNKDFAQNKNQMEYASIMLCARKNQ